MTILRTHSEWNDDESQRDLVVSTDWINQTCSTPGCTVVIRSRAGQQMSVPVCRWCESNTAYYRTIESPPRPRTGPALTLMEFGEQLYRAIELKASLEALRHRVEGLRVRGNLAAVIDAEQLIATKEKELDAVFDTGEIAQNDIRRILAITAGESVL